MNFVGCFGVLYIAEYVYMDLTVFYGCCHKSMFKVQVIAIFETHAHSFVVGTSSLRKMFSSPSSIPSRISGSGSGSGSGFGSSCIAVSTEFCCLNS